MVTMALAVYCNSSSSASLLSLGSSSLVNSIADSFLPNLVLGMAELILGMAELILGMAELIQAANNISSSSSSILSRLSVESSEREDVELLFGSNILPPAAPWSDGSDDPELLDLPIVEGLGK